MDCRSVRIEDEIGAAQEQRAERLGDLRRSVRIEDEIGADIRGAVVQRGHGRSVRIEDEIGAGAPRTRNKAARSVSQRSNRRRDWGGIKALERTHRPFVAAFESKTRLGRVGTRTITGFAVCRSVRIEDEIGAAEHH